MSLLSLCQEASSVLSMPQPTMIVGDASEDAALMLRLANIEGRHLSRRHDWQALTVSHSWTTVASQAQALGLPTADYERLAYECEVWDRTGSLKLVGPTPSRHWSTLINGGSIGGIVGYWRILGDVLQVTPAPSAGRTYGLEYLSKRWVSGVDASLKEAYALDTDVARISEHLILLGLVWRFKSAKGYTYGEDMSTYEREVERACSRDRGARVFRSSGSGNALNPSWPGVITP